MNQELSKCCGQGKYLHIDGDKCYGCDKPFEPQEKKTRGMVCFSSFGCKPRSFTIPKEKECCEYCNDHPCQGNCLCHTPKQKKIEIVPSPRIDWCGDCKMEHGYDCPPQDSRDWEKGLIKEMVDRFLGWKLPQNFRPDCGISFEPEFNKEWMAKDGLPPMRHEPIGTNLFDADQAKEMIKYILGDSIRNLIQKERRDAHEEGQEAMQTSTLARMIRTETIKECIEILEKIGYIKAIRSKAEGEIKFIALSDAITKLKENK